MKNLFSAILFVFLIFECEAQQLSKREFLSDFDCFQSIYEKANAGLYKYHTKQEIDSVFSANRKQINQQTSYREFYNLVWNVIDFTGSCHNDLSYPDSLKKELHKQETFFPIPLKFLHNKLYTNLQHETIPTGSEILSINGTDALKFATEVARYTSTDGHNLTGKYVFLETGSLFFYIYLAYGEQDSLTIRFKDKEGIKEARLKSLDYKSALENYKRRFIPEYEKNKTADYSFNYIDNSQTGLLTVNTFGLGGPKSEGHKNYAAFLDSVFNDLQNKNVQNLIVDIRENGGGNDPNDLLLYSYLTKRNFRENRVAFTLFNTIPLKKYYVEEEKGEIKDLEKELKEEHSVLRNKRYYQNEQFNPVWSPKPNAYSGKIYLLVSPFVASAGSLFASMVKSDEESIVIGQETLGGYYGHTGHIPVTYRLSKTGLLLTFSIVDLEQDVQKLSDQKDGDGVKPDYNVEQSIEEYFQSSDTVLEFAKKMIGH